MQTPDNQSVFREKNLKKATGPEQLNRYLKVTGFGPWFVVITAALLLAALFIWAFFGTIVTVVEGAGYCRDGVITCYFSREEIGSIPLGAEVDISGNKGIVTDLGEDLYRSDDIPNDVLYLLPVSGSSWYSTDKISCDLEDGLYAVKYYREDVLPIHFLDQGK